MECASEAGRIHVPMWGKSWNLNIMKDEKRALEDENGVTDVSARPTKAP